MARKARRNTARALLGVFVLLLVTSCTVKLTTFLVPSVLAPGKAFDVVITGTFTAPSLTQEKAALVLQIPDGVKVLEATNDRAVSMTLNDPQVLALYKAEPVHRLIALSGVLTTTTPVTSGTVVVRLRLLAPPSGRILVFKVSLAAQNQTTWAINDPPGVSDFAKINGDPYAKIATLASDPWTGAPVYQDHSHGLPYGFGSLSWPGKHWAGLAVGDVDADGHDDIVTYSTIDQMPYVFFQRPGSQPWAGGALAVQPQAANKYAEVATGDFNRDGHLDLAAAAGGVWLGNGRGLWTPGTGIQLVTTMEGVAVADVNNDGFDDVAFSSVFGTDRIQVFLSDGRGGFSESSQGLPNGTTNVQSSHKLLVKDVNGDGFADIVWTRYRSPGVWLGDGKGNWTLAPNHGILPYFEHWGVDAADLDGDGLVDLVFGLKNSGGAPSFTSIGAYRNLGNARWELKWANSVWNSSDGYLDVALADFDRDGRVDILAGRAARLEIWRNQGNFQFKDDSRPDLPAAYGPAGEAVAVADFDGDTFPDVAVASDQFGLSVWLNQRTGFSRFGKGGGGSLPSTPAMGSAGGRPALGNAAFTWTLDRAPAGKPAFLFIGLSKRHVFGFPVLPIDLGPSGAPGCSLLVEPRALLATATDGQGQARMPTPIPGDPRLLGMVAFGQWGILEPSANALGVVVSDGAAAKIGR